MWLFFLLCWSTWAKDTVDDAEEVGCLDTTAKAIETSRALEAAFLDAEEDRFLRLHRDLQKEIKCMVSPPSIDDVVQLHRSLAVWQFVSGQHAAARASWGAVQALDPMWSIDSWGLPGGHPLRQLWDEAPRDMSRQTLRSPPGGWLIDGKPNTTFPTARPALIQGFYANNRLWYAAVAQGLAEIPDPPVDEEKARRRRKGIRLGGSIGAGTFVVTSLVMAGVASANLSRLKNGDVEYDRLDEAKHSINTMAGTGVALGGVGVISGTLVWAVKW